MTTSPIAFGPATYGPVVATLLAEPRLPPLGPGKPFTAMRGRLSDLTAATLFPGRPLVDDTMARCCLSGLWLWHNFLDESHTISQHVATPEGSYWHGIMHRREPDYGNAKYWFRRVGKHAIFPTLASGAAAIRAAGSAEHPAHEQDAAAWDSYAFIDRCQAIAQGKDGEQEARRIATLEWQLLFDYCYRAAIRP